MAIMVVMTDRNPHLENTMTTNDLHSAQIETIETNEPTQDDRLEFAAYCDEQDKRDVEKANRELQAVPRRTISFDHFAAILFFHGIS